MGLLLMRWLARWPLRRVHAVGAALGWLSWAASTSYRRRMADHARLAAVAPAQRRAAVAQAGRLLAETPWLWQRPPGQWHGAQVDWTGIAHVEAALAAGRGIVFLTPHMGSFEVTAQAFAERFAPVPITVLFRPARKAWLRDWVAQSRQRPGLVAVPTTLAGVRQMLRALKRGEAVGLLPDQVPPDGMGVWAPFFGRPAYTMTLAARLVRQSGAACLLAWGERLPGGRGYTVHLQPGPDLTAAPDVDAATALVNTAMEGLIRTAPAQYLWGYNRYKGPRGEAQP
ncbi:MAG: lysophospholipid acyltransferase family protein [Proteobacteria bacterium]|nr:lysophospholipid acyltransferase family protein [Pseudomonadota bacterium]